MLTASFSTNGPGPAGGSPQWGPNIFRSSANLVNPQSLSSVLNLWVAAKGRYLAKWPANGPEDWTTYSAR